MTAARGMSVVMQWTTVEAVTTRLGSQQAPLDKQGHFGCAHKAQNLSSKQGCVYRHNTFQTDFSTPWMELVAECIRQERTVKLWMHFRAARAARDAISPRTRLLQNRCKSPAKMGQVDSAEALLQKLMSFLLERSQRICSRGLAN